MTHVAMIESTSPGVHAFEAAQRRGYRTTFVRSRGAHEVLYQGALADRVFGAADEIIEVTDSADEAVLERALRDLHARHPIDAVITTWQASVVPLAHAARNLGLRFTDERAARFGAQKDLGRQRLVEAGVPSIAFAMVHDRAGARAASERIGFPLVVKPTCGVGKLFTQIVRDPAQLDEAVRAYEEDRRTAPSVLQRGFDHGLLLEEHMQGRMVSAEVGVSGGAPFVIAVTARRRARHNEILELGSTMPAPLSDDDEAATRAYALDVTRAFGLDVGMFHVEIMLTPNGPRLIELNPRIAGGSLPQALGRSLGASLFDLLLDIHLGLPLRLPTAPPIPLAMIRFASRDGGVVAPHDLGWLADYEANLVELSFTAKPGQVVPAATGNLDYFGTMMIRAETAARADAIADEILDRLSLSVGFQMAM